MIAETITLYQFKRRGRRVCGDCVQMIVDANHDAMTVADWHPADMRAAFADSCDACDASTTQAVR